MIARILLLSPKFSSGPRNVYVFLVLAGHLKACYVNHKTDKDLEINFENKKKLMKKDTK